MASIPTLKRFTALLFFSMLVFCRSVSFFIHVQDENKGRMRMEERYLRSVPETECIIFQLSDIQQYARWAENGKAFFLDGIMYDIAKVKFADGHFILYTVLETTEIEALSHQRMSSDDPGSKGTIATAFIISDHILPVTTATNIFAGEVKNIFFSYSDILPATCGNILLPPPRMV